MNYVTQTHAAIGKMGEFIYRTAIGDVICNLLVLRHERGVSVIVVEHSGNQGPPVSQCWPELANKIWLECLDGVLPAGNIRFYESEDGDHFSEVVFSEIPGEDNFEKWAGFYKKQVGDGNGPDKSAE